MKADVFSFGLNMWGLTLHEPRETPNELNTGGVYVSVYGIERDVWTFYRTRVFFGRDGV